MLHRLRPEEVDFWEGSNRLEVGVVYNNTVTKQVNLHPFQVVSAPFRTNLWVFGKACKENHHLWVVMKILCPATMVDFQDYGRRDHPKNARLFRNHLSACHRTPLIAVVKLWNCNLA